MVPIAIISAILEMLWSNRMILHHPATNRKTKSSKNPENFFNKKWQKRSSFPKKHTKKISAQVAMIYVVGLPLMFFCVGKPVSTSTFHGHPPSSTWPPAGPQPAPHQRHASHDDPQPEFENPASQPTNQQVLTTSSALIFWILTIPPPLMLLQKLGRLVVIVDNCPLWSGLTLREPPALWVRPPFHESPGDDADMLWHSHDEVIIAYRIYNISYILLMEEILHHLGCIKPCK